MASSMGYFLILLLLTQAKADAAILEGPESVVAFRGANTTFHCLGTGAIFWHIDGIPYDFRNSDFFSEGGMELEAPYADGINNTSQSITVHTSMADKDSMNFSCTVVGPGDRELDSRTASLVIIGVPTPKLSLPGEKEFRLTWSGVRAPADHQVLAYDITVVDEYGILLGNGSVGAAGADVLQYSYFSEQDRSEFPKCSKLVFSLVAVTSTDRSPSVQVSWSRDEYLEVVTLRGSCLILSPQSLQVSFDVIPMPCPYQTLHYNITVSVSGRGQSQDPVTTLGGSTAAGEGLTEVLMLEPGQDIAREGYTALFEVQVEGLTPIARNTTVCKMFEISTSPLMVPESNGPSGADVAILSVGVVITFAVSVLNGVAVGYVVYSSR